MVSNEEWIIAVATGNGAEDEIVSRHHASEAEALKAIRSHQVAGKPGLRGAIFTMWCEVSGVYVNGTWREVSPDGYFTGKTAQLLNRPMLTIEQAQQGGGLRSVFVLLHSQHDAFEPRRLELTSYCGGNVEVYELDETTGIYMFVNYITQFRHDVMSRLHTVWKAGLRRLGGRA